MEATKVPSTLKSGRSWPVERFLIRSLHRALGAPMHAIQLWDGYTVGDTGDKPPTIRIHRHNTLWKMLANPDLHFGEGYCRQHIDIEGDLVSLLEAVYRSRTQAVHGQAPGWLVNKNRRLSAHRFRINPNRARRNAQHHYDLSNDFYRLWLDHEMVYTCAYFADEAMSLERAQFAKMEHICRKLQLKPGDTVIEAGCGWGGLSRHMARHYGVKVKAYNVSYAQIVEAEERCQREGLDDRITYYEDDYRNATGPADVFVSVGMLEHVGPRHYSDLGALIDRVLAANGRGLIHTIGQNQSQPVNPWLHKYIFPDGHPPTLREMMDIFEPFDFTLHDIENIGYHYALTLEQWLQRFESHVDEVREMFDEFFVRMWRLYLSGSIANFTTGKLQLYQALFTRSDSRVLPMTRHYMYE